MKNEATTALWNSTFNKLALYIDHKKYPEALPPYDNIVSTNLSEDVEKYRTFCRQVSLPHFKDPKFMQAAFYLYLREAITAEKDRLPRTDLEFIWRTHRLTPTAYEVDGNFLREKFGPKVRQFHSVRNRPNTASSLEESKPTMIRGAMYRGNTVPLVSMIDKVKLEAMSNKSIEFHMIGFRLANLNEGKHYRLRIRTRSLLTQKQTNCQTFRVKGNGTVVNQSFYDKSEDTLFTYNSAVADVLQIRLSEINMMHSSLSVNQDTCEHYNFDYDFFNCESYSEGKETKLEFSLPVTKGVNENDEEPSWVRFGCDKIDIGQINLFFGSKKAPHVSKSDHFCNVICHPLLMAPYFTKRSRSPCIYMSKPLKDRRNETLFKCRVLRTLNGDFCSTEIFDFNEKLISCSYTAGKDSLPTEDQVWKPENCCVLREHTEMVFVLRSTNFEWGLLKVFIKKTKEGDIIPTQILVLNLKDVDLKWVMLYDKEDEPRTVSYKVKETKLIVDLQAGKLSIPPLVQEFSELLSLGVTVLSIFHCFRYKDTLGVKN